MALPQLELNINNTIYSIPEAGNLIYQYKPFYNLKREIPDILGRDLDYLRIPANNAELNVNKPIEIDIEPSYDQSVNLIINDKENPVKIVNSRFYLKDSSTYEIGDRKGNLDTNIYTKENFKIEASLIKSVQSIVSVDFLGIHEGGKMPIGNYTFYFRLADSDGNESDFIAESGKVVCHIGNVNQPKFIRGGQALENSNKSIKFRLNNIDLAYSFIKVYYTKTTSNDAGEVTVAYKIEDDFRINKLNTEITITGYEEHQAISIEDINARYAEFNSVKTLENCQNISFAGNITNDYELYKTLEKYSLFITPKLSIDEHIGNLNYNYEEKFDETKGYEYYNVDNIYYKLGYWEDIYRIGIVYILNNYTLSPVFNIRGIKELSFDYDSLDFRLPVNIQNPINIGEDYIIEANAIKSTQIDNLVNSKGVFKISDIPDIFSGQNYIKPLGLKFVFNNNIIDGDSLNLGLKDLTKGFFFVRQKRIPTIIAQAIGISTSQQGNLPCINVDNNKYMIESFLSTNQRTRTKNNTVGGTFVGIVNNWLMDHFNLSNSVGRPVLGSSKIELENDDIYKNALLCPEADLRTDLYNTYFNSSEYEVKKSKFQPITKYFKKSIGNDSHYYIDDLQSEVGNNSITTSLLLVEPGIELIKNNNNSFSSKAGDAITPHLNVDVKYGDYNDPENVLILDSTLNSYNSSATKVRGVFNSYIGTNSNNEIQPATYYNIYQKGFDFEKYWKNYFKLRYNDSSSFYPISDRMEYSNVKSNETKTCYRGDCYINTYTHRMNWNFIDPELPTNTRIVDKYNWYKNYKVVNKITMSVTSDGKDTEKLSYRKLLPLFTYKQYYIESKLYADKNQSKDEIAKGVIDSEDKHFKKYSEINGVFGYDKLNRPDINAVSLGHWVTFKIFSNVNLAMRDVDFSNLQEEVLHGMKRSFYPLQSIEKKMRLPESRILNPGLSKTTGNKYYFEIPDVPFIKTFFTTRINYSNVLQESTFVNGNRIFLSKNYQDYTLEYGALVKLVEWYGQLIAVMEHGILLIPVNERAMMKNESGENVYINTDTVLPKNPRVLSNTYGSLWPDSIIKTPLGVYGIDTVAKKIWRTNGEGIELISDMRIQKFLNDNITLKQTDKLNFINRYSIKSHYNAFKSDIIFSFKYGKSKWNFCWNEILGKWITRYSWFPEFSENINNIFYTFANTNEHKLAKNYLYKHGFAGNLEEAGDIKPANWYDQQYPFEFEFVVADIQGVQKIFDNLKIISNRVEPNSFIFEVVGDGYDWSDEKQAIIDLNKMVEPVPPEDSDTTGFGYPFDLKF